MATEGVASLSNRDWLGAQNEVQFFIHSSSTEPLSLIGVEDTSQYTIQVRAMSRRRCQVNEQVSSHLPITCPSLCWGPLLLHKVLRMQLLCKPT